MAKYCKYCGTEIPDIAAFCPQCGGKRESEEAQVDAAPTGGFVPVFENPPSEGGKKKKIKWWMIAIPIVLILAVVAAFVWEPLYVRFAPQQVLAKAWINTAAQLQKRSENNPLEVFSKAVDESMQNTVGMIMDMNVPDTMQMHMDATFQGDGETGQTSYDIAMSLAEATSDMDLDFDISLYMDKEFLSLGVEQFTGETHYGIVYDTVGEDIRSNSFLYDAMGEEGLTAVETFVDIIESSMNMEQPELELDEAYITLMTDYVQELEPTVESTKVELDDEEQSCYGISYTVPVSDIGMLLEGYMDLLENEEAIKQYIQTVYSSASFYDENIGEEMWDEFITSGREAVEVAKEAEGEITVCFHVRKDQIVKMDIDIAGEDADGEEVSLDAYLYFGENPTENDIIFYGIDEEDGEVTVTLSSEKDETFIAQMVTITSEGLEYDSEVILGYEWDWESGDFSVQVSTDTEGEDPVDLRLDMVLTEEEHGFTLEIPDLSELFESVDDFGQFECSVTYSVSTGADIQVPEFTNLKDLTEEMLYEMVMNLYNNYS